MDIAAGIILYNAEIDRLFENISAVYPQVDIIILIDNNSRNISEVEKKIVDKNKVFLIKNSENYGVAKALNQIITFCQEKKCDWVLTLDQDSVVPANLIEEYKKYITIDSLGIICPRIIDRNYLDDNKIKIKSPYDYVEKCITSASLTNIKVCSDVGYFDEKLFIDLVDFEYCIRLRKKGYKILRINTVTLLHQLGNLKVYNILGKKIRVTNHSVNRKYYLARNSIYYAKKHKDYVRKIKVYEKLLIAILKVLFFESNKFKKFKAMFNGYVDGIRIKM